MLILPIKKQWYDMIISGEKKEEYREIKAYWERRIESALDEKNFMLFIKKAPAKIYDLYIRNGYGNNKPTAKICAVITRGYGNPEWGAEPDKRYFIFKILSVKEFQTK